MKSRLIASGLALLVGAVLWADGTRAAPTPEDRRATQEMINRGNAHRASFVQKRADFLKAFDAWKKDTSAANRAAAIAQRDSMRQERAKLKANRDSVIAKVDSTFDTNEPAGTNVQYDPECTDYGYTSSRCFVRICEPSFTSPDDVATTKIHEFEHVRQKQAGRWGPGNVPQVCTFEYHQLEFGAYEAEMDADFGKRTSLSLDTKIEILQRKAEHLQGMIDDLGIKIGDEKVRRTLQGSSVETQVTLTNDAQLARTVGGMFENQQSWMTTPPAFSCFLDAERETTFTMTVQVPPGAPLNSGNEVMGHANAPGGVMASDFFFVNVIPAVDVKKGSNVSGQPGEWVEFHFTLRNEGPASDQFDANVSSVLGWPLAQSHWLVTLGPGESADLQSSVLIPSGAPHTTDLLTCTAFPPVDPAQVDHDWLYAETEAGAAEVGGRQDLSLALMPAVPNPFTGQTLLRFVLPASGPVDLGIYDVAGRRVRVLVSPAEPVAPGAHTVRWDGTDDHGTRVASGMYFARLRACDRGVVRKMVVLN